MIATSQILRRFAAGTLYTVERTLQGNLNEVHTKELLEVRAALTHALDLLERKAALTPEEIERVGATLLTLIGACAAIAEFSKNNPKGVPQ